MSGHRIDHMESALKEKQGDDDSTAMITRKQVFRLGCLLTVVIVVIVVIVVFFLLILPKPKMAPTIPPPPRPIPPTYWSPGWDLKWQTAMSKIADEYYQRKYEEKDCTKTRKYEGEDYTVARPNHGTIHGIRQGLLAVDFARLMETEYPTLHVGKFLRAERKRVGDKMDKKIFFASMFQRTGRESEGANTLAYVQSGKAKFQVEAKK